MQHKNLVRLLGVILHQGLYIVMEHVSKVGVGPEVPSGFGGAAEWLEAPRPTSLPHRATW